MPQALSYASPLIAKNVKEIFGKKASTVKINMRENQDVSKFIKRAEKAFKKTAENSLSFD